MRNPPRIEAAPPAELALPAPPLLSARHALFLDFGGTLVDLAARPERVVVDEELPGTLETLADRLDGAVAIITGRWLADVDGLLARVQVRTVGGVGELAQVLRQLTVEPPFAGREPVFVGDDASDEDGFAVARDAGGYGVKVGHGPTLARYRCPDVADVHAWLRASVATY